MTTGRLSSGQIIRDTYTIVRHLGSGAFGDVYLARHRYMGLQAMKIFSKGEGPDALEEATPISLRRSATRLLSGMRKRRLAPRLALLFVLQFDHHHLNRLIPSVHIRMHGIRRIRRQPIGFARLP
jgi:serine/threonine protein kinase